MKLPALAVAALLATAAVVATPSPLPAQPLAYDTSAWEMSPAFPVDSAPWTRADLERTLRDRTARQNAIATFKAK